MSEWTWIDTLTRQFELCQASAGRDVVVVAETTTPDALIDTAGIALQRTGAASSTILLPARVAGTDAMPSSIVRALGTADLVIDCTAGGVGPLPETDVLVMGSRSPEGMQRFTPHPGLEERSRRGMAMFADGTQCVITSAPGTNLSIPLTGADVSGSWGCPRRDRRTDQWPSGFVAASMTVETNTAAGTVVLMPGDVNATLREIIHSPVTLKVEAGQICDIAGDSGDADGLRAILEASGAEAAYRLAGITLGLNHALAITQAFDVDQPRDEQSQLSAGQVTLGFGPGPMDPAHTSQALTNQSVPVNDVVPVGSPAHVLVLLGLRSATVQVGAVTAVADGHLASELQPDVYEIAASSH